MRLLLHVGILHLTRQAGIGLRVPVGEGERAASLAAGDAIFFCSPEARQRITHVGLILGDGSFIHAAGGDAVRINCVDDAPYGERLVAARRYLCDSVESSV